METFKQHLLSRYFDFEKQYVLGLTDEVLTLPLFNFSGKLVGYQTYRPTGPKKHSKDVKPEMMKYFTHSTEEGVGKCLVVWGLESVVDTSKPVYVCEGVFDAARHHWNGFQAVAALTANPEHLKNFFWLLSRKYKTVACVQGDKAGLKLAKYCKAAVCLPENEDVNSLTETEYRKLFCGA